MTTTSATYQSIAGNLSKALARAAADPAAARETAYFKAHIGAIKSVDDFIGNPRIYNYTLKAFGLSDISYAKGLIRKVLEGGVDNSSSLANKLADHRYKDLATAFNFAKYGQFTTGFAAATTGTSTNITPRRWKPRPGRKIRPYSWRSIFSGRHPPSPAPIRSSPMPRS